jgi:hypothetical protein
MLSFKCEKQRESSVYIFLIKADNLLLLKIYPMKKIILFFATLAISGLATAQSPAGLVAHWNMDSTAADVSGHGHNGTMVNVTPDTGSDGIYGHAYHFNGVNSMITAPYSPVFNLSTFSICAIVKPEGFYSGTCQGNNIFARGKTGTGTGTYLLYMGDWPYDQDCTAFDSTKDAFCGTTEGSGIASFVGSASQDYTPHVVERNWYKVVFTFNDTSYNLFVNGTLKSSVTLITPGVPLGTSTDSVCIGYNVFEASAGYPYPFNGAIDDIMLYNRVLSDSEIVHYADTCGRITTQPATASYHPGGTATYHINTSVVSPIYQWQQDNGSGFVNLSNTSPYSGVFTPTLTITGVTASLAGARYRCLVNNSWGCSDTSTAALLSTGVNGLSINESISVYPNPTKGIFTIGLPLGSNASSIEILNLTGQVLQEEKIKDTRTIINLSDYADGIYILKIVANGETTYRKILKN